MNVEEKNVEKMGENELKRERERVARNDDSGDE